MNENYIQPAMPEGVEEGIVRGIYPLKRSQKVTSKKKVTLMGAGTILNEVVAAS